MSVFPEPPDNSSAGHQSIHLDAGRVTAGPILFEQPRKRIGHALAASVGSHMALGLLTVFVRHAGQLPVDGASATRQSTLSQVVWLPQSGPGGGGGGGGNRMTAPPRQVELPGQDHLTVPVAKPTDFEPSRETTTEPDLVARLVIPATSLASATQSLPGTIESPRGAATESQGPGRDNGAGTGRGPGDGEGDGPGVGSGRWGGSGGDVRQVGSGVTNPTLVRQVRPNYTSDAMRARVQGVALVQCVVRTDGTPTDCEIYRPLDPRFGLDQEALRAARQWRFTPGTFRGQPVNVRVVIEMTFVLR